ncbi:alpha/beta fold hydrolase [Nocardia testacea]|uniref:alpha/beta fold hydrolase n=1 Tax=Nocardia testacea TaxID=248551 RepID=UPI0006881EC9|nr:alpha/beta hydrolase [Nocardia testacea]
MRGGEQHPGDFSVTLPNGKSLRCRAEGPEDGTPIFQIHGTPGSRVDTAPPGLLDWLNVRLITYDRPGYGGSDLQRGLIVASSAGHVRAIADHLRIGEFAVVGRSGGAPHAAAAAAGMPDRVTRLGLLVPLAPSDVMKAGYFKGMDQQAGLDLSAKDEENFLLSMAACDDKLANFNNNPTDPTKIIGTDWGDLGDKDKEVVTRNAEHLCAMYTEALRVNGADAWKEDVRTIMARPSGIDFGAIKCHTMIWSPEGDGHTPSAHAHAIAEALPRELVQVYSVPDDAVGHLSAIEIKPGAYAWLSGREDLALFPTSASSGRFSGKPILTSVDQWTRLAGFDVR